MDGTLLTPMHLPEGSISGALQCAATRRSSIVGDDALAMRPQKIHYTPTIGILLFFFWSNCPARRPPTYLGLVPRLKELAPQSID